MAQRSQRIEISSKEEIEKINPENIKLYNRYEIDMSIRELSKKSIYNYKCDLFAWFVYVLQNQYNQCITELTEDDIIDFIYYCKQQGNNSRRIKRRLSSLSAFYKYLRRKKIIQQNPMEFIERPKKDIDVVVQTFLTQEQVDLMKEKLREYGDIQLELYALFSLSTMARVNAISNIKWEQIDFINRTVNDVLEKEGKIVTLYFNENVQQKLLELKEYRSNMLINDNGYLFITKYNNKIDKVSVCTLTEWTSKIGNMINVITLHPHDFRHSGSQLLKIAGCPIETISELLNHMGLDVTKKHYLTQDKKRMQQEKDKYGI